MSVTSAILDCIHAAGYSIGTCCVWTATGLRHVVTARDARTGGQWTVRAPSDCDAACELALPLNAHQKDPPTGLFALPPDHEGPLKLPWRIAKSRRSTSQSMSMSPSALPVSSTTLPASVFRQASHASPTPSKSSSV